MPNRRLMFVLICVFLRTPYMIVGFMIASNGKIKSIDKIDD